MNSHWLSLRTWLWVSEVSAVRNAMRRLFHSRDGYDWVAVELCFQFDSSYLVDPASSHMLVSKIKPCMSKYKHFIQWNCERLIKSVIFIWWYLTTWIPVVILELIHAQSPDFWEGMYLLDKKPMQATASLWWFIITDRIAWLRAGDSSFKFLPYQLSTVV